VHPSRHQIGGAPVLGREIEPYQAPGLRRDRGELRDRGVFATRQLAKRQLTWLRSLPDLLRLDAGGPQNAPVALDLLLDEVR